MPMLRLLSSIDIKLLAQCFGEEETFTTELAIVLANLFVPASLLLLLKSAFVYYLKNLSLSCDKFSLVGQNIC